MKEFEISKDSWHYRLVKWGSGQFNSLRRMPTDLCAYFKHFILVVVFMFFRTFTSIVFTIAVVLACVFCVSWIGISTVMLFTGVNLLNEQITGMGVIYYTAIGSVAIFLSVATGYFGYQLYAYLSERRMKNWREERQPSFIVEGYRSWRNKYCRKIKFK